MDATVKMDFFMKKICKLTPIQKQLDARFAVNEDPGKNTSSSEQGPINRFENDLFNKHDL